ncbi:MAG TPA: DUF5989 family protein, partial [Gemmataceae bacterium]
AGLSAAPRPPGRAEGVMGEKPRNEFERAAADRKERGLVGEFWDFLRHNRKWWLLPILLVLLLFGLLIMTSGTAATPFIYALF